MYSLWDALTLCIAAQAAMLLPGGVHRYSMLLQTLFALESVATVLACKFGSFGHMLTAHMLPQQVLAIESLGTVFALVLFAVVHRLHMRSEQLVFFERLCALLAPQVGSTATGGNLLVLLELMVVQQVLVLKLAVALGAGKVRSIFSVPGADVAP